MPEPHEAALASSSLAAHLLRGVVGFGLIAAALVLSADRGPIALLLAPVGLVCLRGCPTCWAVGLIQTISARRLRRECNETRCTLSRHRDQA
jgi:hypothetical protein